MQTAHAATTTLTCSGSTSTASDGITADSTLIQNAINAATAGDTIAINEGTCELSRGLSINKALTLQGAKAGVAPGPSGWASGQTKLHGFYNVQYGYSTFPVVISASNVTVTGFEFDSRDRHAAIDLEGTISNITISNNYIYSSRMWGGIILGNTAGVFSNVTIDHNTIVATGTKDNSNASGLIRYGSKVSPSLKVTNNILQQAPIGGLALFGWADTVGLEFSGNHVKSGLVNVGVSSGTATNRKFLNNVFEGGAFGTTQGDGIYTVMIGGTVSDNIFRNGASLRFGPSTLQVTPPTIVSSGVVVTGNELTGAGTVLVGYHETASSIYVNGNSLLRDMSGGGWAVRNANPAQTLDATENYWGTTTASAIAAMVDGHVTYSPYRGDAPVQAKTVEAGYQTQQFDQLQSPLTLTFDNVTAGGNTTVVKLSAGDPGYVAPSGFSLGDPATYFDIQTTATFDGNIGLCFNYPAGSLPAGVEPKLYHYENSQWTDVTSSFDLANRLVCGVVQSLSPFALGYVPTASTLYGFFQPVDMGLLNVAKSGQGIPLKFRLVPTPGNLTVSVTSVPYTCGTNTLSGSDAIEEYTGASGLQYLGDGYWQWNWKTPKTYANQCRKLKLTPSAGEAFVLSPTTIEADFRFTK